ncbi:MAG TPA: hypothetical protein VIZ18_15765 [Ktedonobacteraceae bacterium]
MQQQAPEAEMASLNGKIIQELNATCKEDAVLLERVWERYAAQINAQPAPISQLSTLQQQEKEKHMQTIEDRQDIPSAPTTGKQRSRARSRLMTLANGFAAILIVSLLIIGSVVLFRTHHSTTPASPVAPFSSGKILPPSKCSTLLLDPAEKSLCRAGQYNELDAKGSIGIYTIDVIAGYADPGRIFLANKLAEKNAKGNYILNDIETLTVRGTDIYGGPAQLSNSTGAFMEGMNFDVSDINIPTSIKSLDLTFKARLASPAPNSNNPLSFSSPIVLHFTLPFHPEKRTANLHVTTTMPNGGQVTLEHVLVTQSETIFTLQDYNPGGNSDLLGELAFPGGTLTIGATKISLNTTEMGASVVNSKQIPGGPRETVNIYLSVRLLDQHGEWILSLPLRTPITEGSPSHPTTVDTLVFHFVVP